MPLDPSTFDAWQEASRAAAQAEQRLLKRTLHALTPGDQPSQAEIAEARALRQRATVLLESLAETT